MTVTVGPYCINVTDLDRSVRFYTAVIGLTEFRRVDYHGLQEVILGSPDGGGRIQLAFTEEIVTPIDHGNALRKIYFNVDDCVAVHQRAVDAEAKSVHAPERLPDYPVTYALVADPDGYIVELIQRHDR